MLCIEGVVLRVFTFNSDFHAVALALPEVEITIGVRVGNRDTLKGVYRCNDGLARSFSLAYNFNITDG